MSKNILITGTSTGFGRQTAEKLLEAGNKVFASMRDPEGKNREHADALRAKGAVVVELDVTNDASVNQAVGGVVAQAGSIDVLVNNAGVASAGVSEAFTADQAAALFNVNVIGVHRVTRAVLPTMRAKQSGLVINVGSILGRITFPFFGLYGASKFAVEALTDSYRYELSQFGVDVALVQPSAFPTQMYSSAGQPEDGGCVEQYGDVGQIPVAMFEHFMSVFSGEGAPNPEDVAVAIADLVATPAGERAARTVVGAAYGSDTLNEATDPVQNGVVEALGLASLAKLKAA